MNTHLNIEKERKAEVQDKLDSLVNRIEPAGFEGVSEITYSTIASHQPETIVIRDSKVIGYSQYFGVVHFITIK